MGLYSTISTSNSNEMLIEKMRAQAAEKAAFGNSVLAQVQGPFYSGGSEKDVFVCKDGCDDGRISFSEKVSNFCNGVVAPIKNIFASPKNMAVTALTVAAGAGLIALTGGAAAPVMVALGLIGGGTQIASGLYKQATATTDAQAAQAWNQMGTGTFTMGASALGAKSALKAAGVQNTSNMTTWQAVVNCVKNAPNFFSQAVSHAAPKVAAFMSAIKSGKTPKTPNAPKTPSSPTSNPRLEAFKKKLGLNKGEPKVTVEPKARPRKASSANPPKVIELPKKLETIEQPVVNPNNNPRFTQNKPLGLPAPEAKTPKTSANPPKVIELSAPQTEVLGLPAPKPQYKINYTTEEYFPQNVLMPGQQKPQVTPQGEILGLPAPKEVLALPAPKTESIATPTNGFKTFLANVVTKIKESLNLFGIFIK